MKESGHGEEIQKQTEKAAPQASMSGKIDKWFDKLLTGLPANTIEHLKEQVAKYITEKENSSDGEKGSTEELTDDELIENAKKLIDRVQSKFTTDGGSTLTNCMIVKKKLTSKDLI